MANAAAEKRSVATDALETLGTKPIPEDSGRDAIHLAVEPVIAGTTIFPGQDIGLENGLAGPSENPLGIADPFMTCPVKKGERFWLVVYPRQITSLRHVWSHPAFPEDGPAQQHSGSGVSASERWLRNYADEIDEDFDTLMDAAAAFLDSNEYFKGERTGDYYGKFEGESTHPDFWTHYEAHKGVIVPESDRHSFFTCSC